MSTMALSRSARLEAALFSAGEPLSKKRLAALLDILPKMVDEVVTELRVALEGRGLTVVETPDEVELRTCADASDVIRKLRESELARDLGKAGLETMAMILYKNGATRSDIDWVRGVNSGAALRSLLMRGLIERTEDPSDKRRAYYLPTIEALAHLGVSRREDLPHFAEYSEALRQEEQKAFADA